MRVVDIIGKKKRGYPLSNEEITFLVDGFTAGEIPDYQMSAFLMAVCLKGMDDKETAALTLSMAKSGDTVDLSSIEGKKVDKHSTGGVGDKTTLIISPIVAALGVPVAKMSGRALGHTGGTVDKLESIPGFKTSLSREEFLSIVKKTNICVAGQSGNLAPADKKIYALRDVTATVDNISLIAASIMSKKLAAGADAILLDVKTGSGAFMKTPEESMALAKAMVDIGERSGKAMGALVTDMDRPLGYAIGNCLEIKEVLLTLKGQGPSDLTEICLELSAAMLALSGKFPKGENLRKLAEKTLANGTAYSKFMEMVTAQGGDITALDENFGNGKYIREVKSPQTGYIAKMDTEAVGVSASLLGAGRSDKNSEIDYTAGITLIKKTCDFVNKGDVIALLHTSGEENLSQGEGKFLEAISFSQEKPEEKPLIYARIQTEK